MYKRQRLDSLAGAALSDVEIDIGIILFQGEHQFKDQRIAGDRRSDEKNIACHLLLDAGNGLDSLDLLDDHFSDLHQLFALRRQRYAMAGAAKDLITQFFLQILNGRA